MILGEHELCQEVATATNPEGHNSHLNIEQMNKVWLAPAHSPETLHKLVSECSTLKSESGKERAYLVTGM